MKSPCSMSTKRAGVKASHRRGPAPRSVIVQPNSSGCGTSPLQTAPIQALYIGSVSCELEGHPSRTILRHISRTYKRSRCSQNVGPTARLSVPPERRSMLCIGKGPFLSQVPFATLSRLAFWLSRAAFCMTKTLSQAFADGTHFAFNEG